MLPAASKPAVCEPEGEDRGGGHDPGISAPGVIGWAAVAVVIITAPGEAEATFLVVYIFGARRLPAPVAAGAGLAGDGHVLEVIGGDQKCEKVRFDIENDAMLRSKIEVFPP